MKKFENKQTGILSSSDLKTVKGKVIYWIFTLVLFAVCLVSLLPALWTICSAFKETKEIYSEFSFFPKHISWDIIVHRISDSWIRLKLGVPIINTIVLSLGQLVIGLIVPGFAGYVLSKLKPRGSKYIFVLVVWTMMMPSQIRMVPNYVSMLHFPFAYDWGGVNLLDTYWPMWISAGAGTYNVILFKNAFDGLSQSYVEAAKLDGCSNYGVFFKIMLPLSMPIIIFVSIGLLSGAWSDFFGPLLYLDKNMTVPLKVYKLKGNADIQMNTYFMCLIFASIPPFIIYAIFQKQIMGGVNIGGVKG